MLLMNNGKLMKKQTLMEICESRININKSCKSVAAIFKLTCCEIVSIEQLLVSRDMELKPIIRYFNQTHQLSWWV